MHKDGVHWIYAIISSFQDVKGIITWNGNYVKRLLYVHGLCDRSSCNPHSFIGRRGMTRLYLAHGNVLTKEDPIYHVPF